MSLSWKAGIAGIAVAAATTYAAAQMGSAHHDMAGMMMMDHAAAGAPGQPTLPGQDAFAAIQEIVAILDADPSTDWSKVDIAALREHLIDMNEVTLNAEAVETRLPDGVGIDITGSGRTLIGIGRMVQAQARQLNGMNGWSAKTEPLPNGVRLTVTTRNKTQVAKLQALGFMGLMVEGHHHQAHHLMIAKGEMPE